MRLSRPALSIALVAAAPATAAVDGDGGTEPADPAAADVADLSRPLASVTAAHLSRRDLDHRLHLRPRDLLRHIPGLTALARGGGGAPQLLLRGFDAGAGAELEVTVDGVPQNLGSHTSAHGAADPQFLIADAISSLSLLPGTYAASQGELATAGTLALRTLDAVPGGGAVVRLSSGLEPTLSLRTRLRRLRYQLAGMFSPALERGSALLAAEIGIDDGPTVHPQRYRRGAVLGKLVRPVGGGTLTAALQLYAGRWFDSGVLSRSSIDAGRLTPFSASDPTQGGLAVRGGASLSYEVRDRRGAAWHLSAYAVDADLRLYDNPSLFLRDADAGDALEHLDRRRYYGAGGTYHRPHALGPLRAQLLVGVSARTDAIDAQTWHAERRLRLPACFAAAANPCTDASRRHGLEARLDFAPTPWLSLDAALGTARGSFSSPSSSPPAADPAALSLPLAPRLAASAGVALHRPSGFVSLRLRALGPRTTTDPAFTARGHTLVDLIARRRLGPFELGASVENLLDARYAESQLAASVRPSRHVDEIRDLLVSPGAPLTLMLTLGYAP